MDANWYDQVYSNSDAYRCDYTQSPYYFSWCVIADRILRSGHRRVLEIGCGSGQFAAMLRDQGIAEYVGLDFSPAAVAIAKKAAPSYRFVVGDARSSSIYSEFDYETLVCTEVLEHIDDDLAVVAKFAPTKRCICTVPNFPYVSHVRHFDGIDAVRARYEPFFDRLDVVAFRGIQSPTDEFFLFEGIRREDDASRSSD
jgi:SAM-dependent methyltransferase